MSTSVIERVRSSNFWTFAGVLPRADHFLAFVWWTVLIVRGVLPAVFAVLMGMLVGAVQRSADVTTPLALFGCVFVLLQILPPIHRAVGANLGSRTAAWLYDQLTAACVRPPGMGHLENPQLTTDLTVARDFDLGITGPPMSISMDFIAGGLVEMVGVWPRQRCSSAIDGGRRRARKYVDGYALAAARKRYLARSQYRRSTPSAASRRLCLSACSGTARRKGIAPIRPG
ncbi:MAG: hypothetical protein ACR2JB_01120 [Bryobacteraceae bacterium]